MIQKLGNALKTIARRALLRGDRDASNMISDHGLEGFRSNMSHEQAQIGHSVETAFNTTISNQKGEQIGAGVKAGQATYATTHTHKKTDDDKDEDKKNNNLGSSIIDALE